MRLLLHPSRGLRVSRVLQIFGPVLLLLPSSGLAAQSTKQPAAVPVLQAPSDTPLTPELKQAIGAGPFLQQLRGLEAAGQGNALEAVNLRQQILERVLLASFEVESTIGRIDTEISYNTEDDYQLQQRNQHQAAVLNLVTFAASGALGAAGSSMQLTRGLNHAGTALSAAAGGTALVLSAVQLKSGGGKQAIRSPYNMLAEILDVKPNAESAYPALIEAYLREPQPGGQISIAAGLSGAWRRLGRLKDGPKGGGSPLTSLTADRAANVKVSNDDLTNREAMLRDLRANIQLLQRDLQQVVLAVQATHPGMESKP